MTRQTTQKLITVLYPGLSHEDTLQGESNSITTKRTFVKGTFTQKARAPFPQTGSYLIFLFGLNVFK